MARRPKKSVSDSGEFNPRDLDKTVIAVPLIEEMQRTPKTVLDVIVDFNLDYAGGRQGARAQIRKLIDAITSKVKDEGVQVRKSKLSQQYVFASLRPASIRELARRDAADPTGRAIYKIWFDHEIVAYINKSISTVKADAARNTFGALGHDIVWAVIDSGVDRSHPHFKTHDTLSLDSPLYHRDFATNAALGGPDDDTTPEADDPSAGEDQTGHGTHVAGIIAGEIEVEAATPIWATINRRLDDESERLEGSRIARDQRHGPARQDPQPQGVRRDRSRLDQQHHRRARVYPGPQQLWPPPADPRREPQRRLRFQARSGSPAARARSASRSTGWSAPASWW